ncbi:MAG: TonB-dependent receptor, partial [Verrucomicrobiota bacterium]
AFRNSSTNAYEVGLKGSALEGKASFTASLFFNDTSDEQFFIFNPLAGRFQVENADSESYGAEFEFAARLAEGFFVTGGLGFLDTKATSDSLGGSVKIGNEIPYAPEISYNFGAQYLFSASGLGLEGDFFLRGEYQGVGTRMMDPANTFELESYQLANLRFAYRAGQYELYLFGRNVFDESLVSSGFSAGFNQAEMMPVIGGVPGLPRMYGAGFEMRF